MTAKDFYKKMSPELWETNDGQEDAGFYGMEDMVKFAEKYRDHCRDEWIKEINQIAMVQASYSDDEMDREKYLHGEYVASLCANLLTEL